MWTNPTSMYLLYEGIFPFFKARFKYEWTEGSKPSIPYGKDWRKHNEKDKKTKHDDLILVEHERNQHCDTRML